MKRYTTGRIDINYTGKRLTKVQRELLEETLDLGEVEYAMENAVYVVLNNALAQAKIKQDRFTVTASF